MPATGAPTTVSLADEEAVRRILTDTPLIFAGRMWQRLLDWASQAMLRPGFELASAEDMRIPVCVDGADQAIAVIREHLTRWLLAQGGR